MSSFIFLEASEIIFWFTFISFSTLLKFLFNFFTTLSFPKASFIAILILRNCFSRFKAMLETPAFNGAITFFFMYFTPSSKVFTTLSQVLPGLLTASAIILNALTTAFCKGTIKPFKYEKP